MIDALPRTSLLLETDCPYLAPEPGGMSEPAHVAGTVALMSERWGMGVDDVTAQLAENFERLMGFAP